MTVTSSNSTFSVIGIMLPILLCSLAFLIGLGFAQYHLSKSPNKALGLILPIVFFVLGFSCTSFISLVLSVAALAGRMFLFCFIPSQLPAIVYTIIYFAVRSAQPKNNDNQQEKEIKKMNIQDL